MNSFLFMANASMMVFFLGSIIPVPWMPLSRPNISLAAI